jgi:type III pantothenate kinase
MKRALAHGTDALPFNELDYALGPANFTEAAIYNGTLSAAVGLIEYLVRNNAGNTRLILTGGDAELIAKQLGSECISDSYLVLRGLSRIVMNA